MALLLLLLAGVKSFIFILALGLSLTPSFSEEGDKAKVRTFTSKERPGVVDEHGGRSNDEEAAPRRRPVVDYGERALTKKEGHPFGESLVFPQGYRYKVTNW